VAISVDRMNGNIDLVLFKDFRVRHKKNAKSRKLLAVTKIYFNLNLDYTGSKFCTVPFIFCDCNNPRNCSRLVTLCTSDQMAPLRSVM